MRCGSLADEFFYAPIPLPVYDELIHAIDEERTVLFIWRPRKINPQNNLPEIDRKHVNIVRSDISPDPDEADRALSVSNNAIDDPAWVASIIDAMGFILFGCRFGTTLADKVPDEHWEFLSNAVSNQRDAL